MLINVFKHQTTGSIKLWSLRNRNKWGAQAFVLSKIVGDKFPGPRQESSGPVRLTEMRRQRPEPSQAKATRISRAERREGSWRLEGVPASPWWSTDLYRHMRKVTQDQSNQFLITVMGRVLQNYTFDKISGTVHLKSQCILFILCELYINKTYLKRRHKKLERKKYKHYLYIMLLHTQKIYTNLEMNYWN